MTIPLFLFLIVILSGTWLTTGTVLAQPPPDPPPILVRIPETWLAGEINRNIDRQSNVNTVVLGTCVVGQSRTTGRVEADVLESDQGIVVQVAEEFSQETQQQLEKLNRIEAIVNVLSVLIEKGFGIETFVGSTDQAVLISLEDSP